MTCFCIYPTSEPLNQVLFKNSTDESILNDFGNLFVGNDDSYHFNSAETDSAAFTTVAASSFSMRPSLIVNMEPVTLMDATT